MLEDLGHPQPKTPVHCDNATAIGIANNTIKRQRSRAMEMRYFWVADKIAQDRYQLVWHPGQENLADYEIKRYFVAGQPKITIKLEEWTLSAVLLLNHYFLTKPAQQSI